MSVTLHTTQGDLKIEVFCESVPKTAEVRIPIQLKPSLQHHFNIVRQLTFM